LAVHRVGNRRGGTRRPAPGRGPSPLCTLVNGRQAASHPLQPPSACPRCCACRLRPPPTMAQPTLHPPTMNQATTDRATVHGAATDEAPKILRLPCPLMRTAQTECLDNTPTPSPPITAHHRPSPWKISAQGMRFRNSPLQDDSSPCTWRSLRRRGAGPVGTCEPCEPCEPFAHPTSRRRHCATAILRPHTRPRIKSIPPGAKSDPSKSRLPSP
jgi:hypothetical protein